MRDPINEEIHKYRQEHARKFNFDLAAICEDLRATQRSAENPVEDNLMDIQRKHTQFETEISPASPQSVRLFR